jgi:hypothetical protein|tara:strand:+ start:3659 stop:3919 length:261 start_codon:yes stop_codon:yes gene_type:complete
MSPEYITSETTDQSHADRPPHSEPLGGIIDSYAIQRAFTEMMRDMSDPHKINTAIEFYDQRHDELTQKRELGSQGIASTQLETPSH